MPEENREKEPALRGPCCTECGSDDIQTEGFVGVTDEGEVSWRTGGFYCASCGYLLPKTAAGETPFFHALNSLEVCQLCARSQLAFSLFMELEWKPDVILGKRAGAGGYELEIRPNHNSGLLVLKDDLDDRKAVLITTTKPREFCFRGWLGIREAKSHPEWLAAHGGREEAWLVPRSALLDFQK
jgi:hypothetical protein